MKDSKVGITDYKVLYEQTRADRDRYEGYYRELIAENEELKQRLEKTDNYQAYKREKRIRIGLEKKVVELEQRVEKPVELPCKIADVVYICHGYICVKAKVMAITVDHKDTIIYSWSNKVGSYNLSISQLNKKWFLTKAEAEKALLEGKE